MLRFSKIYLFFCLCIGLSSVAFAQNDLRKADHYFKEMQYSLAIPMYKKIIERKMDTTLHIAENLAACYRLTHDYKEAEHWYNISLHIPYYSPISIYYYAQALQTNGKYKEAEDQYRFYALYLPKDKKGINEKIQSCIWARTAVNNDKVKIKNEKSLNSKYSDWGIAFTSKGALFASDKKLGSKSLLYDWTGAGFYKIYFAAFTKKTPEYTFRRPRLFERNINGTFHNFGISIDSAENNLYMSRIEYNQINSFRDDKISSDSFMNRSAIYHSTAMRSKRWDVPEIVPINNIKQYSMLHPCITDDGKRLYFASDKPGGYGSFDIYYVDIIDDGSFSEPINLGPEINTPEAEITPFIYQNQILYYASKGRIGLGGFDIFSSSYEKGTWKEAINLGKPINSSKDDFGIYWIDSNKGYFSSDRDGGIGADDIYSFEFIRE